MSHISIEQAQNAALDAADIAAANADIFSATLGETAGITCYRVEFASGDHFYTYAINAETGEVLEMNSRERTVADIPDTGTQTDSAGITAPYAGISNGQVDEAKAQEIALTHAGVNVADATITKIKLDDDDGQPIYEIEWYTNDAEYTYKVAVATGEVVQSDYEAKTVVHAGSKAAVSESDAKKIAVARVPGAVIDDIFSWELDYDDDCPEYEGKIIYNDTEYEFTIDGTTGAVTEWDTEVLDY